jgi:hypothetical protein
MPVGIFLLKAASLYIYRILKDFAAYQCTWKSRPGLFSLATRGPFVDWILRVVDNRYLSVFETIIDASVSIVVLNFSQLVAAY